MNYGVDRQILHNISIRVTFLTNNTQLSEYYKALFRNNGSS